MATPPATPDCPAAKRAWRVRTDKGDVFGPADLDTLKVWARDGRLAPTNEISEDGRLWTSVTIIAELEMDWVAEVTPGSFYGPIHKDALAELAREGSVSAAAPVFCRRSSAARAVSEREQALGARLLQVQQELAGRAGEMESQFAAARLELEQSRSNVSAKDLEFDAERQELRASGARLQAELLKRDGRIAALEKEMARLEPLARERPTLDRRVAEAEKTAAAGARLQEEAREQVAQARAAQREVERGAAALRERAAGWERELETARESVRTLKLRLESVRKLLQQAATAAGREPPSGATPLSRGAAEIAAEAEDIEVQPGSGGARDGPPPVATPLNGAKPGMSLADLEAQAQRELRQLGNKGASLFHGRAKG